MKKIKYVIILLILLLTSSSTYANTMYVKNQTWTNSENMISPDYTYSIVCEDEKIDIISTGKYMQCAWIPSIKEYARVSKEQRVSSTIKNGRKVFIKNCNLTTKKPKYTYTVRNCNKEFTVLSGCYLYEKPVINDNKIKINTQLCVATIGQTNKWYQVYYNGKAYFIKKDSKYIKDIHNTEFPVIKLDGVNKSCIDRVKYYYSMVPKKIRDLIIDFTFIISDGSTFEKNVVGKMSYIEKEIYLSENANFSLEYAFFHEIGHEVYRLNLPEIDLTHESNNLALSVYHSAGKEFYAEGFELYIKQYGMLKNKAPQLFAYYDKIVEW